MRRGRSASLRKCVADQRLKPVAKVVIGLLVDGLHALVSAHLVEKTRPEGHGFGVHHRRLQANGDKGRQPRSARDLGVNPWSSRQVGQVAHVILISRHDQVFLGGEVMADQALRDIGALSNRSHRGPVHTLFGDQRKGRQNQRLFALCRGFAPEFRGVF